MMKIIEDMTRRRQVYLRSKDIPRVKSLISSAKSVSSAVLNIPINEENSTLIFRELYESIKQLGDALWWALGYESEGHEASLKILASIDVKEKLSLHKLDRFRRIRHDSNYRGYKISLEQAKEIVNFWKRCNQEIISFIEKRAKN